MLLKAGADIKTVDLNNVSCLDYVCKIYVLDNPDIILPANSPKRPYGKSESLWRNKKIQELIINKQPHNIKFFDDKIGILPELNIKYKDIIEL